MFLFILMLLDVYYVITYAILIIKYYFGYHHTYNKATTKLAFHSNETSKDKQSIIYNWLSIIVIQVHAKIHKNLFISTCSLHWNVKSSLEVCKNLFYGDKHSFIEWTFVVGAH